MKQYAAAAAALAIALGALAAQAQSQNDGPVADSRAAFSEMAPDAQGAVVEKIMHAPAGDVQALIVGHAPKQVRTREDQLLYVISGRGTIEIGYPSFEIQTGSVVSIPRDTAYEITAHGAPMKALLIASPHADPNDKKIL